MSSTAAQLLRSAPPTLHQELLHNGAEVVYGPVGQEAYHMEKFAVRDREGCVLGFGQPSA